MAATLKIRFHGAPSDQNCTIKDIHIYIRFQDIRFAQTSVFIQNVIKALILEEAQQSR